MKPLRDLPISRKLVVVGAAASALALVVSSVIFLVATFFSLRENVRRELDAQAAIIIDSTKASLAFREPTSASETVQALRASPTVDAACVFENTGALFASYLAPGSGTVCPPSPPPDGESTGDGFLLVRPIISGDSRQGTLYLKGNLSAVQSRLRDASVAALFGISLGIGAAVLLSRRMQRIISDPIRELSATAARISGAGDYSLRANRLGDDEVGQLVETFNGMVAEVERRDEQLRRASRLKDEFLAALSHELRTPLNAILGWSQVLRNAPPDPATTSRAYESIDRNARAQARLIEDLLDISSIISGKLTFKAEPVDLTAVVETTLDSVKPSAEAKNITVSRDLASPQLVLGDAHRLQQIVWNLLSNALKFTARDGHVTVSLRAVEDACILQVTDDGIGIEAEFLAHVFDRFRQADGSMARRHGGLGLGLAIVRELTSMHGGTVDVESKGSGLGATFRVALPRMAGRPVKAIGPATFEPPSLGALSVLVVDDDVDSRELALAILTAAGAAVRTAASADEALNTLSAFPTDLILCDLAMPGIDGYELLSIIRQQGGTTPAVAVSAHAGSVAETRARESGFQAFVAKPYDLQSLFGAIREATHG